MKRKLFTTALSLALAGVLCMGLAACNDVDPWKMESVEVTAEQWAEAFKPDNFQNVKIEIVMTQTSREEDAKLTVKGTVVVADDVQYIKTEAKAKGSPEWKALAKGMNEERYSSKSQGEYTVIYRDKKGKWTQSSDEAGLADAVIAEYVSYGVLYTLFTFEDAETGYTADPGAESVSARELSGIRLKFKDGKIAAFFSEKSLYQGDIVQVVTFTYGGQKLTLPSAED